MATQYTEEFKKDAVRYWQEHKELGINACAKNPGISKSALSTWRKLYVFSSKSRLYLPWISWK